MKALRQTSVYPVCFYNLRISEWVSTLQRFSWSFPHFVWKWSVHRLRASNFSFSQPIKAIDLSILTTFPRSPTYFKAKVKRIEWDQMKIRKCYFKEIKQIDWRSTCCQNPNKFSWNHSLGYVGWLFYLTSF